MERGKEGTEAEARQGKRNAHHSEQQGSERVKKVEAGRRAAR